MNQKGFGMNEMLAFLFVIFISFIIATSAYNQIVSHDKFKKDSETVSNPEIEKKEEVVPTFDVESYQVLENLIASKSKDYFAHNSKEGKIDYVPLQTLIQNEYIGNVNAVDDENQECTGYVEYLKVSERYKTYLSCGEYYQTVGYDALKEMID